VSAGSTAAISRSLVLVGRDPAAMSFEARLAEIAQVLAVGFRRLQLREQNRAGIVDVGAHSEASCGHANPVAGVSQ